VKERDVSEHGARPALVDARWIGIGGPGRVAEHLLQGLHELEPSGAWVVWGPDAVDPLLWPGATRVPNKHHPKALYSQREYPGPKSSHPRVAYYAHHLRPGWKIAPVEVTTVHDTIPFRYPPSNALAPLMRRYIAWMAHQSTLVVTDSEFSKASLQEDLGLDADRIAVLKLAIDHDAAARVRALRAAGPTSERVIFVGRDGPHKNLDRLVTAFATSDFAAGGAVLTVAGVDGGAVERLRAVAAQHKARVELPGIVSQSELEQLLASSALLVQPSLEEGFGLPVAEAMAAGIPVAISTAPALLEITRGAPVAVFDPLDVEAIAHAIDQVAAAPGVAPQLDWPRPVDFARSVLVAIDRAESLGPEH
jgi:glycosyltransferase involved in cell wall biosynthesis